MTMQPILGIVLMVVGLAAMSGASSGNKQAAYKKCLKECTETTCASGSIFEL